MKLFGLAREPPIRGIEKRIALASLCDAMPWARRATPNVVRQDRISGAAFDNFPSVKPLQVNQALLVAASKVTKRNEIFANLGILISAHRGVTCSTSHKSS
jgi:hypothetical protein